MKEEALKLADKLDGLNSCEPVIIKACEDMIRKLVAELDKPWYMVNKDGYVTPLSADDIDRCAEETGMWCDGTPDAWDTEAIHNFARAIEKEHGIKNVQKT